jgi:cytochrome P450
MAEMEMGHRKRPVVKHVAPPYTLAEIRDLLGITEKDMRAARRWLQSTAEEPGRKPRVKTAGVKRAAAKVASKLSD